jgi:hypothetical protein
MSIETATRAMLTAGITSITDARITHGYRLQDSALPAVTFEIQSIETISVGAAATRSASVEIRAIAETTIEALDLIDEIRAASVSGTWDSYNFDAVLWQSHTIDPPSASDGDEAQPVEAVATINIYYRE